MQVLNQQKWICALKNGSFFFGCFLKGGRLPLILHDSTLNRIWIVCANQLTVFHNSLHRDTQHKAQLEDCHRSDQVDGRVEFPDENGNLLSKSHLRLPSPNMDRQVSHLFWLILHDEKNWIFYCCSTSQQKDNWTFSGVDWTASHQRPPSCPPPLNAPSYPLHPFTPEGFPIDE